MKQPAERQRDDGGLRRVGVEIEFSEVDLDTATREVASVLGGEIEPRGDYRRVVHSRDLGEFTVEVDFELLHRINERRRDAARPSPIADWSEELLAAAAESLVPIELVSPPLPMNRLDALEPVVERLRAAGAVGTRESFLYAFGLHLNPELARLSVDYILAHLRAYLCLHDWLVAEERVDWSRRITPYIRPFGRDYARRVIADDYAPTQTRLILDYLEFNPDRNRALDMLPLFAFLDENRVREAVQDPRIKSRPAFHYRLPNCEIELPDWSIRGAWERWLEVERLAADPDRLRGICAAYARHLDATLQALTRDWAESARDWLQRE